LTVVYDAGQNSCDNHTLIEDTGIGFVGSLPPSDHPSLLAIPTTRYRPVDDDRYPGVRGVDTEVTALGVTRRAVLTHSPTLHDKQSRGFDQTLAKARRGLAELQAKLARGKTRRDLPTPLGGRSRHHHPDREHPGRIPTVLAHRPTSPQAPGKPDLR
jgi:transposase